MPENEIKGEVNSITMTPKEVIEMINVLSKVVELNKGWLGSESTMDEANKKIKHLIKLIN